MLSIEALNLLFIEYVRIQVTHFSSYDIFRDIFHDETKLYVMNVYS